ncbi:hypothetical protein Cgig2_025234 [Carnegiea gigantea]|uniref:Uncharacterized protein n=1 Tax=Carnegiea gigantea TaxID=171969 RepID=A0A9Q1GRL6_9CARY|nr:hypothetical protein Cgig2_025234 [Carnegiea gigantea]
MSERAGGGGGSGGRGRGGGYNNPPSQCHHYRGRGRGGGGQGGGGGGRAGYASGGGARGGYRVAGRGSDGARGGGCGGRPGSYAGGSSSGGQGCGGGRGEGYGGGGGRREGYGGGSDSNGRREGYGGGGGGRRKGYSGGRGESSSNNRPTLPTLTGDDWAEAGRSLSDDVAERLALSAPAPRSFKELGPLMRPGVGGQGRLCVVKANHFFVQFNYDGELHHYDVLTRTLTVAFLLIPILISEVDFHQLVSIDPEFPSKKVCRDIMTALVNSYKQSHLGNLAAA